MSKTKRFRDLAVNPLTADEFAPDKTEPLAARHTTVTEAAPPECASPAVPAGTLSVPGLRERLTAVKDAMYQRAMVAAGWLTVVGLPVCVFLVCLFAFGTSFPAATAGGLGTLFLMLVMGSVVQRYIAATFYTGARVSALSRLGIAGVLAAALCMAAGPVWEWMMTLIVIAGLFDRVCGYVGQVEMEISYENDDAAA